MSNLEVAKGFYQVKTLGRAKYFHLFFFVLTLGVKIITNKVLYTFFEHENNLVCFLYFA